MLANRLRKRKRHLAKWGRRRGISCYRLYERDIPDQPLIVDWYEGEAVVWAYRRKRDETDEQDREWLEGAVGEVRDALGLEPAQVFVKRRERQRGEKQYEPLGRERHVRVVKEHGLSFEVNLSDYVDTGLFLDHRPTRVRVREEAAGTHFLNLFGYTGAFTCYAAAGDAKTTTTVDLSRTYCSWARRNLEHNGVRDRDHHRVIRADCIDFLEKAVVSKRRYDLVVCDPPTFSNSKRMRESFSVRNAAEFLLDRCHTLLRRGGVLYFSTNDRRFRLPEAGLPPFDVEDVTEETIPDDFRNRRIHRCWRMVRRH